MKIKINILIHAYCLIAQVIFLGIRRNCYFVAFIASYVDCEDKIDRYRE